MRTPDWVLRILGRIRGKSWREDWLFDKLLHESANEFFSLWLCRNRSADYELVAWSRGAEKLYGFPREYALGKSYIRLIVSEPERAEALITTEQTITDGIIWRNYLNRDIREDGSLFLTLTQNIRVWNPFDCEYQFAEIGLDVSDLFESEHALFERRNEDRLSVNEMTRLHLLGKKLGPASSLQSLNDVARLVADELTAVLFEDGATSVWLVHQDEPSPRVLAKAGSAELANIPPQIIYNEGTRRDGATRSPRITSIQTKPSNNNFVVALTSLALSPVDAIVVSVTVADRPHTERSRMFLESLMETCATAIHQWLIRSELWLKTDAHSRLALVEAELVARELSHIAKNRLTTIQNIVFLLRTWSSGKPVAEELKDFLNQLETAVAEAVQQLLHAQAGLSPGNALVADIIKYTIARAVPERQGIIEVIVEPIDLRLQGPSFNFDTVISNLVRNAVDSVEAASAPMPKVVVRVTEISDAESRLCEIEVHDNGPGVQNEIVSNIYSGLTTKGHGRGQGLQNLLRAVNAVGGKVSLPDRSSLLGGAVFKVVYPLEFRQGRER